MTRHTLVIEAGRTERHYWRDIWRYRELFYFLAWRDVLVRYKQTVIGITWALLRPLLVMFVFTFVFNRVARLPSGDIPYPVMVLAGLLPWQFFATALSEAGNSLIQNANLVSKIYFPRFIVPASSVIVSFVDFLISAALLTVLMAWYGLVPDWRVVAIPLFTCIVLIAAIGSGLWLAALNVKYRDFRYIIPFIVQFGLYLSPVGFATKVVPEKWQFLYSLNPMVGAIDGFRWSLLNGSSELKFQPILTSVLVSLLLLISGIWYFRKVERGFADVI